MVALLGIGIGLTLAGCASTRWQAYDAGLAKLWVNEDVYQVDAQCRKRGARASWVIRGCADLYSGEIFAIPDPAVIAHEIWHATTGSLEEPLSLKPINNPSKGPS